jgi:hypothetical protein
MTTAIRRAGNRPIRGQAVSDCRIGDTGRRVLPLFGIDLAAPVRAQVAAAVTAPLARSMQWAWLSVARPLMHAARTVAEARLSRPVPGRELRGFLDVLASVRLRCLMCGSVVAVLRRCRSRKTGKVVWTIRLSGDTHYVVLGQVKTRMPPRCAAHGALEMPLRREWPHVKDNTRLSPLQSPQAHRRLPPEPTSYRT